MMNRAMAIGIVKVAFDRVAWEFCIGEEERRDYFTQCREALRVLGVTEDELGELPVVK